jgi:hypothetical protein
MISEKTWKRVWLSFGILFISISVFMLLLAPWLASLTGTTPFSNRARAMISFFWVWMFIYKGVGFLYLAKDPTKYEILLLLAIPAGIIFSILQISYIILGLFELVISEVLWALIPLISSTIGVFYIYDKKSKQMQSKNYVDLIPDLLKRYDGFALQIGSAIGERFAGDELKSIIEETRDEFVKLVPDIQFIGHKNMLKFNLIDTAMLLALYRILSKRGTSLPEYGKIIYDLAIALSGSLEGLRTRIMRRLMFTRLGKNMFSKAAAKSQLKEYPGDWVFEAVEGDGVSFDLGVDYYECGIQKFLQSQNTEEIGPYLCFLDYAIAGARGSGLQRTTTLIEDGEKCDFRWKQGGETKDGWPPPWLKEG